MTTTEPELVDEEAVTTAVVRAVVPAAGLTGFFDSAFRELVTTTTEQGLALLGPAFALYRGPFGETVDLEVGFPVDRVVRAQGNVVAGELPGGRLARVTHSGSFDGLGEAWARLADWVAAQGRTPGAQRWESYVTQPSPDMDPRDLRTELFWPVDRG
jgi:effector-binding domain-containing protein